MIDNLFFASRSDAHMACCFFAFSMFGRSLTHTGFITACFMSVHLTARRYFTRLKHFLSKLHLFCCLIWLISANESKAQKNWTVQFPSGTSIRNEQTRFANKSQAVNSIRNVYGILVADGYTDCKIDTIVKDSSIVVQVVKGERYLLKAIRWTGDSLPKNIRTVRQGKPRPFNGSELGLTAIKVLTTCENNGYPFASIQVENLDYDSAGIIASMRLDRGKQFSMDSLVIKSEQKMPVRYVRNYINFGKNDLYDESQFSSLEKKLREIPFLQMIRPPEVLFKPTGKADLYIYLKKKKANYFNGILGIRPDDVTGKINLTGDAEIKLLNALNTGEEFYLNWRKMQAQTQELTVKTMLPFVLNAPLGIDGGLKIYKRDTTFSSVKTALGLVLQMGGRDRLKVFVERNQISQLSSFVVTQALGNVNSTLYGLAIQKEKLDYVLNPRTGYSIVLEAAAGSRKVASNNLSDSPSSPQSGQIYRIESVLQYFQPTFRSQCIRAAVNGATVVAEKLYDNEIYRFGGLRTMRGIDEESIFATSFAVFTLEYRLLFEENSALYLFADQGWYEKKGVTSFNTDTPISYGAGVNFETKAGIFTFNYSLGQQFNNPVLVRNAKVSFGFTSVF